MVLCNKFVSGYKRAEKINSTETALCESTDKDLTLEYVYLAVSSGDLFTGCRLRFALIYPAGHPLGLFYLGLAVSSCLL